MSLQLILGSSGAGKSHYLYTHIIEESMKNPDRNYIVVVAGAVHYGNSEKDWCPCIQEKEYLI